MSTSLNCFVIFYCLAALGTTRADGIAADGTHAKIAVVHDFSGGFPSDVIGHVVNNEIQSLNLEILPLYVNGTRDLDGSDLFDEGRLLQQRNDIVAVVGPSNSNGVTLFHPHAVLMNVPHVAPMATDPTFDGVDRFPMLVRMTEGYNYQIDALLDLVTQLNWTSLAIISSESDYAHHAGERLRQSAEDRGVKVLLNRRLGDLSGNLRVKKHLNDIKRSGQKITVLVCDRALASHVLREAEKSGMAGEGWGWILWSDVLDQCPHEELATTDARKDSACTPKIPGLLAARTTLRKGSVYEKIRLATEDHFLTLEELKYADAILAAAYGIDSSFKETEGEERTLLHHILSPYDGGKQGSDGVMGRIKFDARRRVAIYNVLFDVLNMGTDGQWSTIGQWSAGGNGSHLDFDENKLILPGKADKISAYLPLLEYQELTVITMETIPFVKVEQGPRWQAAGPRRNAGYSGYCIDLLEKLSSQLGFKYKMKKLGAGGKFGMRDPVSGYWNGLIGELVSGKADLALAPITVTEERAKVVDFISPFMKTDLKFALNRDAVTNRDGAAEYGRFSFLQPFSSDLWVAIVLTAFLMSFYLSLVSRLSPYGAHGRYFQSERGAESSTRLARRRSSAMMLTSQEMRRRRSSLALLSQDSTLGFGGSVSEGEECRSDLTRTRSSNVKLTKRVSFSDQSGRRGVIRRKSSVTFDRSLLPSRYDLSSTDERDSDEEESEEQERRNARRFMSINNALYFACAGLLWQSPECVPRSPSARVAASVWYMVGVIIVASYTANMVAFVTQTSATTSVRTVTDLLDQKILPPATVASSSVDSLLMTSSLDVASRLYKEILRNPSLSLQPNESSALTLADSGRVAFVWEGVPLDYHALAKSGCRTTTIPLGFGRASYALALRRGSHFTEVFNRQILRLRQSGYLEELRMKYFQDSCDDKNLAEKDDDGSTYVQLTFSSLSGVFIMISVAAALSIVILVAEWIIVSLSDIDRTDPKKPSDLQSAIRIRLRRLKDDFQNNWPFKKIREYWSKFRPTVHPTYRRDITHSQVQPDQWKRYVATPGCEKLTRGQSISDPDLQLEETEDEP